MDLPKQYDHRAAEQRWYPFWEKNGYFHSEPDPDRKPFAIVIPPPNVTGALHLGHALNNTLQDIVARFKRMQGFNVLWMPGTDHAGIATQAVVERRLLEEEGKTRHDLGREALVKRIWAWKDQYETRILSQLKQMGCSCDWERTRFTLDETCARAVRQTFFDLFREGLIFRGKRLVNWDTHLQTAVSDDEVFHEEVDGHFWHLKYPVIDPKPGEPTHVSIATTRPETMLGDTAVAVHPDPAAALNKLVEELQEKLTTAADKDKPDVEDQLENVRQRRTTRLSHLEQLRAMANDGRKVLLPLVDREIPLIADEWAKPEMGSGCVKITPAHDANDYEVYQRHPEIGTNNILNSDGTLNSNAGPYEGETMKKARQRVVADMEKQGLVEEIEDRKIDLAHSDRSKTPIEPFLADQWFVKMDELAQSAMDAVSDGRVKIIPDRYAKSYLDWLSEKRDWCISRNLWWGHRIPIWSTDRSTECETWLRRTIEENPAVAIKLLDETEDRSARILVCVAPGNDNIENDLQDNGFVQEDEVLDTWFSSALWPHSTLGWPEKTPELDYYYPTGVLITSRDIITLWVARMVLAGLHNIGEIPFHEVYIHPKILDGYGETMSKSKGNGVDPLDVIEKFGADPLRFGIAHMTTETQDVRMPVEFECPHCQEQVEQTKKNRVLPAIQCKKCGESFSTQWAQTDEDKALPRGAVVGERFELGRNFTNKLWNASRFALMNLDDFEAGSVDDAELQLEDRWLLSRLATVTSTVTDALENYRYAEAARTLYDFAWDEFCSFYVEMVKARFDDPQQGPVARRVLAHTLDTLLRLLHPIIPFLTEDVWHRLGELAPQRGISEPVAAAESIMIAPWPTADPARQDQEIEARFARFQTALSGIREIRNRQNVHPRQEVQFSLRCDTETAKLLEPMEPYFLSMAAARATQWGPETEAPELSSNASLAGMEIFVDLADLIDIDAEIVRNEKEISKLEGMITGKEKKLSNQSFVERAPAEVVEKERQSLADLRLQLASLEANLANLRSRS
ncbi:MAG: valine--tRNA ligase [Pirellulales bacterium]